MKKVGLIIGFTLVNLVAQATFSQTGNKFKFGIKGGANFSNISTDNAPIYAWSENMCTARREQRVSTFDRFVE